MTVNSLRARLFLAAVLWTLGLISVVIVALTVHRGTRGFLVTLHEHHELVALASVACMVAGVLLVRGALLPFDTLRRHLSEVRAGGRSRLDGAYPPEVVPLVQDMNALLSHSEQAVARATAKAGDLAHGLKTPLAVLANEADRMEAGGQHELAAMVAQQVRLMRRQTEYHLAHARAAASGAALNARSSLAPAVEALTRTMQRLHAERELQFDIRVPADIVVRVQRTDLDELLGNLLDNACKWTRSRISVASSPAAGWLDISVEDDGPGIDVERRSAVLQRGVRADEAVPGTGLGLAIVRDLAELYGGAISLETSPLGGLRARLRLPAG